MRRVTAQPGGRDAKTAEDGTYHLRLLAGSYTLTAKAEGYTEASTPVSVVDDATATADFSLRAPTAAVDTPEIDRDGRFRGDRAQDGHAVE